MRSSRQSAYLVGRSRLNEKRVLNSSSKQEMSKYFSIPSLTSPLSSKKGLERS
jgi:hypothetical protein